jgi:Secretion system C-terminal sorting domain
MKKIALIFFTFSGIYTGFAQSSLNGADMGAISQKVPEKIKPAVQVSPNPARNKVELDITGFDKGYLQVFLFNNTGKTVKHEKRLLVHGNETVILMFSLEPGLYYLQLKQGSKNTRTKLVIQ